MAETEKRKRGWSARDFVLIALAVFLIGGLIAVRAFVVQPFRIPSASMSPTLVPGEYIAARHASGDQVAVGDLVVQLRDDGSGARSYVRRVVALPGQRIAFEDGVPVLDGVRAESVPEGAPGAEGFVVHRETLAGRTYATQHLDGESAYQLRYVSELIVPPGHVYLVGDNRDNSLDSRIEGPYPLAEITHRGGWIVVSERNRAGQELR